jgi:tetratricopeptide (TPR) repeat protein
MPHHAKVRVFLTVLLGFFGAIAAGADPLGSARAALYRGRPTEAAATLETYLRAQPRSASALSLLAQAHLALGMYERAFSELRSALETEPRNHEARYFLVKVCGVLSEIETQALLAQAPDSARAHQILADAYAEDHNAREAEREYLAALEKDPTVAGVLDALGDLKRNGGDVPAARVYYQRALQLDRLDYDGLYGLGACYLMEEDGANAVEFLRRAARADAASPAARFALGRALHLSGDVTGAITELRAAVSLAPDMRQAYAILGQLYRQIGKESEAAGAFEKFRELEVKDRREQTLRFEGRVRLLRRSASKDVPR